MSSDDQREIAAAVERVIVDTKPGDGLRALDDWGIDDLLEFDTQLAITTLYEARGRHLRGDLPLERLLSSSVPGLGRQSIVIPLSTGRPAVPAPGGQVDVDGWLLAEASCPDTFVTIDAATGDTVVVRTQASETRVVRGLDPDSGAIHVQGPAADHTTVAAEGTRYLLAPQLVRALAHELCAVAENILRRAADYATERVQFGQPLATLQVVRHKLVDVHVAIEAARALLATSWLEPQDRVIADAAKTQAGEAFMLASRHGQQISGGIGFTAEFGLHRYIRRGYVLDELLVGSREGHRRIGSALAAQGTAPPVTLDGFGNASAEELPA